MKKLFIILFMLVYGFSSSGMSISLHYCCGKLDGISFSGVKETRCKMGNHKKMSGCCNDQQISTSVTADQQLALKTIQFSKQVVAAPAIVYSSSVLKAFPVVFSTPKIEISPQDNVPIFIKNCVYRI